LPVPSTTRQVAPTPTAETNEDADTVMTPVLCTYVKVARGVPTGDETVDSPKSIGISTPGAGKNNSVIPFRQLNGKIAAGAPALSITYTAGSDPAVGDVQDHPTVP
jgi:hypothetical protein